MNMSRYFFIASIALYIACLYKLQVEELSFEKMKGCFMNFNRLVRLRRCAGRRVMTCQTDSFGSHSHRFLVGSICLSRESRYSQLILKRGHHHKTVYDIFESILKAIHLI